MSHCDRNLRHDADSPPVFIVVLNRYGRPYTLECLHSLATLGYPHVSAILIDNGCEEFSADEVERLLPGAHYLRSECNLGFTGGVNLGIRRALDLGAHYTMLLNNDTRIEPDTVSELVRVARSDASIGIVGAKLLQLDAPGRLESAGLRVNLRWGRVYQIGFDEADQGQYDGVTDVQVLSGGAMMLSRALCEKVGLFDDRYYRYHEDVDICMRAHRAGFRVVFAPGARVHHKGKGMSGGQTSPVILYYATRNHLLLMREYGEGGSFLRPARSAISVALNVAYALRGHGSPRRALLQAVWRAVLDYRRGVFGPGWPEEPGRTS